VLAHGDGHDKGILVSVSDGDQHLGDSEHLSATSRVATHPDGWFAAAGDLDVLPPDSSPTGPHRLHHRLLSGETSGETSFRACEAEGVLPLMLREAAFSKAWVLIEDPPHPLNVGEVDTQTQDSHVIMLTQTRPWRRCEPSMLLDSSPKPGYSEFPISG